MSNTKLKDLLLGFGILFFFLWFGWMVEQDRNLLSDPSAVYTVDR
jgi:hypothetical protein